MQNEFEKQVQQKLEELNLVPSEPVWQKVEMRIREKKDRRRLLFWLPVGLLLLGGGLWFALDQNAPDVSQNKTVSTEKQKPVITDKIQPEEITGNKDNNNTYSKIVTKPAYEVPVKSPIKSKTVIATTTIDSRETDPPQKNIFKRNKTEKIQPFIESRTNPDKTGKNEDLVTDTKVSKEETKPIGKTVGSDDTHFPITKNNDTITVINGEEKKIEEQKADITSPKPDSTFTDTASVKKPVIMKAVPSKWKYAVAVKAGVSGSGKLSVFNGFFNGQKSMDYAAGPSGGGGSAGGQIYYPPSDVKSRSSFTVQALAKKQMGKRTSFSAGLQYNYYSNSILVGNRVTQSAVFRDYAVSQYYSNQALSNSVAPKQTYHNRYHFISLPVLFDWQLLKKAPLNFSTEFSLQYLIQTNGLLFDYNRQAYFHNKNAFNRMQLFSGFGLNYSFPVKGNSLIIGPEMQYGLSRLEKSNSNDHLFSYGLKAQFQFNRK